MKISEITKKPYWARRKPGHGYRRGSVLGGTNEMYQMDFDCANYELLTQGDFADELEPTAHKIYNCSYRSMRPIFKYDEAKKEQVFDGYEDVERVGIGLQDAILRHKVTHCFGNRVWFGNESGAEHSTAFSRYKAHWESTNMRSALISMGHEMLGYGDGAVCLYLSEDRKKIEYKVFGYGKGDLIATFINPEDKFRRNIIRKYRDSGAEIVEIYRTTDIQTYIKETPDKSEIAKWWGNLTGRRTEDGFVLYKQQGHGGLRCPVSFHREDGGACWSPGQGQIEDIEKMLSDLMESNKYFAFQVMFLTGKVSGLPSVKFQGKVIAGLDKNSDAKMLQPADGAHTFELALKESFKQLGYSTGSRFIDPADLKGNNDSGAFLRNLYFVEAQWAEEFYARFDPTMRHIIDVFKSLVGKIEGINMDALSLSYQFTPFVPSNTSEEIQNIVQSVASKTISLRTGREENPLAASDEEERAEAERLAGMELDATTQQQLTAPLDGRLQQIQNEN